MCDELAGNEQDGEFCLERNPRFLRGGKRAKEPAYGRAAALKSWRRTNMHNKWLLLISVLTTAVIAEPQEYPRFGLRVNATELARLNIPVQLNTSVIATPGLSFTSGGNTQNMTERGEDWYTYIRPGLFGYGFIVFLPRRKG